MRLATVLLLGTATLASACSCGPYASAKTLWQQAPLVFLGTVEHTALDTNVVLRFAAFTLSLFGVDTPGPQRAWLRAREAFKNSRTNDIYEFRQPSSNCDIQFRDGASFLIYASQDEGGTWTAWGACGGSKGEADAADDLRFLRALPQSATAGTRLSGLVEGHPNVRVRILDRNTRVVAEVTTNASAVCEVYGLPPGRYTVAPDLRPGASLRALVTGRRRREYPPEPWVELAPDAGETVIFHP